MVGTCCGAAETGRAVSACTMPIGLEGQVAPAVGGLQEMCSSASRSHGGSVLAFPDPQALAAKSASPAGSTGGRCCFLTFLSKPGGDCRRSLPATCAV